MTNMIFDTHTHYNDEAFDPDRESILRLLPMQNVCAVIDNGGNLETSAKAIELSKKYSYIYAAVGFHPEYLNGNDIEIDSLIYDLEKMLDNEKVVAVGEIGLDYHFNSDNKDVQKKVFESQVKIAIKHNLPIIVHDRDAHGDTLEILKKYKPCGVVHCFSGSVEMAREILKIGMSLGIGGVVTFKNAKHIVEVVKEVPISSIVLETDAPYLAPVPLRGKRCISSYIEYTAKKVAELKNMSLDSVLRTTKNNAIRLFNIN